MLFALMVVSPVTLLHGDGDGLSDAACRADLHRDAIPGLCPLLTVATSMPWKRCM